jgi:cytochrome c-type biogenesis protein
MAERLTSFVQVSARCSRKVGGGFASLPSEIWKQLTTREHPRANYRCPSDSKQTRKEENSVEVSLFAALLAGTASFLSPCVLPLLPGYVSLMSGYDMAELAEGNVSMRRVVGRTGLFVLGFSAVFVGLGATATSLSGFLNQSIFTTIAGWLIIAMGLFIAVTAVWTPSFLLPVMKDRRMESSGASRLGLLGPPVMGAAFAFGWTPCIGPFLASALLLGANSDTVAEGMLVLLFYSIGLGIPFLLTSILLAKAFSAFNWVKRYLTQITVISGLMLAFFGVLMVTGRITDLSAFFSDLLVKLGLDGLAEV